MCDKVASVLHEKRQRKGWQPRRPGQEVSFFFRDVENGGKFHKFCEEETADVLPTNSKNTNRQMTSAIFRMVDRLDIPRNR